jgi:hypothetical protein
MMIATVTMMIVEAAITMMIVEAAITMIRGVSLTA